MLNLSKYIGVQQYNVIQNQIVVVFLLLQVLNAKNIRIDAEEPLGNTV